MAERSFVEEVKKLRLGAGEVFSGEGILAVTKALLESGVAYVAGYQGAPISHLMDVLADAQDILGEHGIRFENSASEATAAATLAASVNYPLRGAVTFKATVGTNVASDALANLASGGVLGGALIIVGEDYGEGSSIMQERSHAFAMKSQMWLLDPRPNLPCIVQAVKDGFDLSEASSTPVMLQMRIRSCHVHGQFVTSANRRPAFTVKDALENPTRDLSRIVLPPASFQHEKEKVHDRWPAAIRFIQARKLNEFFSEDAADVGIALQGGNYNTLIRALQKLGLADVYGESKIPLYVMNVAYPLVDAEFERFCQGKRAILVLEEGQPNFVEQNVANILRRLGVPTALHGKDLLPMAGEYNTATVLTGVRAFLERYGHLEPQPKPARKQRVIPLTVVAASAADTPRQPALAVGTGDDDNGEGNAIPAASIAAEQAAGEAGAGEDVAVLPPLEPVVHARPPGFCTGCPERPIFTAMKLVEREPGAPSRQRGHRLPPVLHPAALQPRQHHDGIRPGRRRRGRAERTSRQARHRRDGRRRLLAQRPDQRRRQRGVQPQRQPDDHRRQQLHLGHRRPGHPLVHRAQPDAQHGPRDRAGRQGRRRRVGPHDQADL